MTRCQRKSCRQDQPPRPRFGGLRCITAEREPACSSSRRCASGFSVVELMVVMGIVSALMGVLIPMLGQARQAAIRIHCASNLRQVGAVLHTYVNQYQRLPVRAGRLAGLNPHVFKYQQGRCDISEPLEEMAGARDIFY